MRGKSVVGVIAAQGTDTHADGLRILARLLVRAHLAETKPDASKTLDSAGDSNPSLGPMTGDEREQAR